MRLENPNDDNIKCDHYYAYYVDDNGKSSIEIRMQSCETMFSTTAIFWIIFVFTVIIGIIGVLIYRLITYVKDKREYVKFEKEIKERIQQESFEMQSPIYKSPITYYNVPKMNDDDDDNYY